MLEIIKTELSYNKNYIIVGLILLSFFMLAYLMSGNIEKENIRYTMFSIVFWTFFFARWGYYMFNKDNLERVYAKLPIELKKIAVARLIPGIVLWLIFLSIVLAILIAGSYFTINTLISVLFLNGLAMIMNAFIFIWHDIIFIKPTKIKKRIAYVLYYIVAISVIALVYISTSTTFSGIEHFQDDVRKYVFTPSSVILSNFLALIAIIISYYTYPARTSYLKSEFGLKSNIKVKSGDIT